MNTRTPYLFIIAFVLIFYSCYIDQDKATRDKFEWSAQAPAGTSSAQINTAGKNMKLENIKSER